MELMEAIRERHAVRAYTTQKIEEKLLQELQLFIADCNQKSGLRIQLCADAPSAFQGFMAHYGKFKNVHNFIALVGKKGKSLEEDCGYYGEKVVLKAQQLGLNTCWVALSYSKKKAKKTLKMEMGESLVMVIALGYGETAGIPHKSKPLENLYQVKGEAPDWFLRGMEAVQLAPTAINQQKFVFTLEGNRVTAVAGFGPNVHTDLGIAKCHFEIGAGEVAWFWG